MVNSAWLVADHFDADSPVCVADLRSQINTHMDNYELDDAEFDALEPLPSETPEQSSHMPRWQYTERKNPKWGTVTRQGLIVGRGVKQATVPPDEVYRLGALGCTDRDICDWFGIDEQTLRYNFKDYLLKARIDLKQRLRRAMLNNAIQNNSAAVQIFLAKNILGMSDQPAQGEAQEPLPWSDD